MQLNRECEFYTRSFVGNTMNKCGRRITYDVLLTYITNTISLKYYVPGITCVTTAVPENACSFH